jgi:thymidine phosphorylase
MRSKEDSLELAKTMVEVGKRYGVDVVALLTNMNQPLGNYIGNALEI